MINSSRRKRPKTPAARTEYLAQPFFSKVITQLPPPSPSPLIDAQDQEIFYVREDFEILQAELQTSRDRTEFLETQMTAETNRLQELLQLSEARLFEQDQSSYQNKILQAKFEKQSDNNTSLKRNLGKLEKIHLTLKKKYAAAIGNAKRAKNSLYRLKAQKAVEQKLNTCRCSGKDDQDILLVTSYSKNKDEQTVFEGRFLYAKKSNESFSRVSTFCKIYSKKPTFLTRKCKTSRQIGMG